MVHNDRFLELFALDLDCNTGPITQPPKSQLGLELVRSFIAGHLCGKLAAARSLQSGNCLRTPVDRVVVSRSAPETDAPSLGSDLSALSMCTTVFVSRNDLATFDDCTA